MVVIRRALTEMEMSNLQRIATHEHGHAVIAAHFGVGGKAHVYPVPDQSGAIAFSGVFICDDELPSAHAIRLFGLAGIAAEAVWGRWHTVAHVLIAKLMSPEDSRLAGDFEIRDVAEAIGLIQWYWGDLEHRAREAMQPWLQGPMVAGEVDDALAPEAGDGAGLSEAA